MKLKNLKSKYRQIVIGLAITLVVASLFYIAPALYFHYSDKGTVAITSILPKNTPTKVVTTKSTTPVIAGYPNSISIPSVWINNVPIVTGVYDTQTASWNVGLSVAQYVPQTALPNNTDGYTYIYGHYRPAVFAYLHHIVPGGLAYVTTTNGLKFTYKFVSTYAVAPSDTAVLSNYAGAPILLLQTCSGSFFQNRQFYVFDYVSYTKVTS